MVLILTALFGVVTLGLGFYLSEKKHMKKSKERAERMAAQRTHNAMTKYTDVEIINWNSMSAQQRQDTLRESAERREAERKSKRKLKAEEDRYAISPVTTSLCDTEVRRPTSSEYSSRDSNSLGGEDVHSH